MFFHNNMACGLKRCISSLVLFCFFFGSCVLPNRASAQMFTYGNLPVPGSMVNSSAHFIPVMIKGLKIYGNDPLKFDFILDSGNAKVSEADFQNEGIKLAKYFLAGLTVSEKDLWVNLSPYEKERIIPESFGQTILGRDLLAQDYILKQLSSSLIHPNKDLGKTFWNQVYAKAKQLYGTTNIPVNTFNKVWIVPDKAGVWENNGMAFVTSSHLKVLSEEDYLSLSKNIDNQKFGTNQISQNDVRAISKTSADVVRQLLLPAIEKEVNEGKNFANLRQIYNAMILAVWYKQALKESLLSKVYVNQNKTTGVDDQDKESKLKIYHQYLAAFKKGVFNFIKEEPNENNTVTPRKYFSGGANWAMIAKAVIVQGGALSQLSQADQETVMGNIGQTRQFTWKASEIGLNANLTQIFQPTPNTSAAMTTVETPVGVDRTLKPYGLSVLNIQAVKLKGNLPAEQALALKKSQVAWRISMAQARGSILFAGQGKGAKEIADGNAVYLSHEEILDIVRNDPQQVFVVIADEGGQDKSFSLKMLRIYSSVYQKGFHDPIDTQDYIDSLKALRTRGKTINDFVGDALENTNSLVTPETKGAWALTAIHGDSKKIRPGIHTGFHITGVSFNAPSHANVGPFDLPSVAIKKVAVSRGIPIDSMEYSDFVNHFTILTTGPRTEQNDKHNRSSNHRHSPIIEDVQRLKKEYPGLKILTPGDGDLAARLLASAGLDLGNGREIMVLGRSGAAEARGAEIAASLIPGGQFNNTLTAKGPTDGTVTEEPAHWYTQQEEHILDQLGYTEEDRNEIRKASEVEDNKGGAVALTAVTGAEAQFGPELSELLHKVTFNETEGTVTLNTLLVTPDGVYVVRTTLKSENVSAAKKAISTASPEAAKYVAANPGLFPFNNAPTAQQAKLAETASKMITAKSGFLALDETAPPSRTAPPTSTADKVLEKLGIPEEQRTFDMRQDMRRIFMWDAQRLKAAGISAVIVHDEHFEYTNDRGENLVELLRKAGIFIIYKADSGLEPVLGAPAGVMRPKKNSLENLPEKLRKFGKLIDGTKWRATLPVGATEENILENLIIMAKAAKLIQEAGLVPTVEPEVLLGGEHSIEASYETTTRVIKRLFELLKQEEVYLPGVILKTSMILSGNKATNRANTQEVGYQTLKELLESVPEEVAGVLFLSGGQKYDESRDNLRSVIQASGQRFNEAVDELSKENKIDQVKADRMPQGSVRWLPKTSFSYGRGLQQPALDVWRGDQNKLPEAREKFFNTVKEIVDARQLNRAQTSTIPPEALSAVQRKGGIDLRPELFDLQIKRDTKGIPLPVSQQPISSMKIQGFMPITIDFKPVNLPLLLGTNNHENKQQLTLNNF